MELLQQTDDSDSNLKVSMISILQIFSKMYRFYQFFKIETVSQCYAKSLNQQCLLVNLSLKLQFYYGTATVQMLMTEKLQHCVELLKTPTKQTSLKSASLISLVFTCVQCQDNLETLLPISPRVSGNILCSHRQNSEDLRQLTGKYWVSSDAAIKYLAESLYNFPQYNMLLHIDYTCSNHLLRHYRLTILTASKLYRLTFLID